jgi:hypothetical protein
MQYSEIRKQRKDIHQKKYIWIIVKTY